MRLHGLMIAAAVLVALIAPETTSAAPFQIVDRSYIFCTRTISRGGETRSCNSHVILFDGGNGSSYRCNAIATIQHVNNKIGNINKEGFCEKLFDTDLSSNNLDVDFATTTDQLTALGGPYVLWVSNRDSFDIRACFNIIGGADTFRECFPMLMR